MRLSEFVLTETVQSRITTKYKALVNVTTGALFWKKVARREIMRRLGSNWYFTDTGEFTPGSQAEQLERAYRASIE